MTLEFERNNMRVCYQHWIGKHENESDIKQLTIVTYAMFLELIDKSENKEEKGQVYINDATSLLDHGLENGWVRPH